MNQFTLRVATPDDAATIAQHRTAMFQDMGLVPTAEDYAQLLESSTSWLTDVLAKKQYAGWLIESDATVVAGGGVLLRDLFPVPGCHRVGVWAHIMNVYTVPEYRRRGLARMLMRQILDWCAAQKVDQVTLTASQEGRTLYESLGFKSTSDMRLSG